MRWWCLCDKWWYLYSRQNWPIKNHDQMHNTTSWRILFTWLWRWLPLRESKRQLPTAVFLKKPGDHTRQTTDTPGFKLFTNSLWRLLSPGRLGSNYLPNSLSEDYSHPDDHTRQTTDTPGFKPFTNSLSEDYSHPDDHTRESTDNPGFKLFTNSLSEDYSLPEDHTRQTTDTPGFTQFTKEIDRTYLGVYNMQ